MNEVVIAVISGLSLLLSIILVSIINPDRVKQWHWSVLVIIFWGSSTWFAITIIYGIARMVNA